MGNSCQLLLSDASPIRPCAPNIYVVCYAGCIYLCVCVRENFPRFILPDVNQMRENTAAFVLWGNCQRHLTRFSSYARPLLAFSVFPCPKLEKLRYSYPISHSWLPLKLLRLCLNLNAKSKLNLSLYSRNQHAQHKHTHRDTHTHKHRHLNTFSRRLGSIIYIFIFIVFFLLCAF